MWQLKICAVRTDPTCWHLRSQGLDRGGHHPRPCASPSIHTHCPGCVWHAVAYMDSIVMNPCCLLHRKHIFASLLMPPLRNHNTHAHV